MADTTQLDIKLIGLGQIIAATRHAVPICQRSYAWKYRHVEELLSDVASAIHTGDEEYFLGSIVLTNSARDQPDVVDGQRRLATTVIVISAIRDYLLANEQKTKADEIGRKYLATVDLRTEELEPHPGAGESDCRSAGREVGDPNGSGAYGSDSGPANGRMVGRRDKPDAGGCPVAVAVFSSANR
jgi:hypothetical protein